MADDLSGYKIEMEYCLKHANDGSLTTDNSFYKRLKQKSLNLPDLARWLAREIDTKINQV